MNFGVIALLIFMALANAAPSQLTARWANPKNTPEGTWDLINGINDLLNLLRKDVREWDQSFSRSHRFIHDEVEITQRLEKTGQYCGAQAGIWSYGQQSKIQKHSHIMVETFVLFTEELAKKDNCHSGKLADQIKPKLIEIKEGARRFWSSCGANFEDNDVSALVVKDRDTMFKALDGVLPLLPDPKAA